MSPHMSPVKVYLVTGGLNDRTRPLASTELLTEGAKRWVRSTPLPSGRLGLTGGTLDNKIIIAGRVEMHSVDNLDNLDIILLYCNRTRL